MALADKKPSTRLNGLRCSVGVMLSNMPDEDRKTAESWLANPVYSAPALLSRFQDEDYTCKINSIGHHRRKRCSCYAT